MDLRSACTLSFVLANCSAYAAEEIPVSCSGLNLAECIAATGKEDACRAAEAADEFYAACTTKNANSPKFVKYKKALSLERKGAEVTAPLLKGLCHSMRPENILRTATYDYVPQADGTLIMGQNSCSVNWAVLEMAMQDCVNSAIYQSTFALGSEMCFNDHEPDPKIPVETDCPAGTAFMNLSRYCWKQSEAGVQDYQLCVNAVGSNAVRAELIPACVLKGSYPPKWINLAKTTGCETYRIAEPFPEFQS